MLCGQQTIHHLLDRVGIGAQGGGGTIGLGRKIMQLIIAPVLGQGFSGKGQIHRPLGIALHHAVGTAQGFFGNHPGRQVVVPFDILAHQATLVIRLLHKIHKGVAGSGQFTMRCVGGPARHQHQWQAGFGNVVDAHGGIGRSRIHVNQHPLAPAGRQRITRGHVHCCVFVRAQNGLGKGLPPLAPTRHLFNQGGMVRAQVAKQIIQAQLIEALQQMVGCGVRWGLIHGHGWGPHGAAIMSLFSCLRIMGRNLPANAMKA